MASDNVTKNIDDNSFKKLEEAYTKAVNSLGKCNILVIGKTGVGKSTLINAVFGENLAEIGVGKRITESIQKYHKKASLVAVYDTPGLQLFSGEEIVSIRDEVSGLIEKEPIHVVWYCINSQSNRFEEIEEDWIRDMARQGVPIILILTQALPDNDSEFLEYLKEQELPVIDVIPVLAEPQYITSAYKIPAWGLENLVEITASTLTEVARNAFLSEQRVNMNLRPSDKIPEEKEDIYAKILKVFRENNIFNQEILIGYEKFLEDAQKNGKFNAMVIGLTGVGKSTLINAVFGSKVTKTGTGKPVTQEIKKHSYPNSPITIYDTPGLEADAEKIKRVKQDVVKLIEDQRKQDPKEHIHFVWYCINEQSKRFQDAEEEWIRELVEQELLVIIVLTQTYDSESSELLKNIKGLNLPVNDVIPVLAEPLTIGKLEIPAYGLQELIKETYLLLSQQAKKARNAVEAAAKKAKEQDHIGVEELKIARIAEEAAKQASQGFGASQRVSIFLMFEEFVNTLNEGTKYLYEGAKSIWNKIKNGI
ncbi:50S ribosome-binding GTPase [Nostoc sp. CHAB 5836]|uniref:GTPase family protein n=1 Tax=Nostoc sp. CHAB 5836 TaxID=2780404 RepID=UPI001E528828|nr:GTPase [Nostoc sp. CHAB 5836]MCC5616828.1 50S ribosome-binding GTPase [Nostoc sp. CHAB 5836]